ncbi:MAG: aldo/keto reductase [Arenicella sp.]
MKYSRLGSSGLKVSKVCLGTMTWGEQNTQDDANQQLDYAFEQGVNFIDTAEVYAVPPKPETQGDTERMLGNWLIKHPVKRQDLVVASKVAGPGLSWIRNGDPISPAGIRAAIEGSLQRMQTDYIDLYQLHWPNRTSPHFCKHWPASVDHTAVNVDKERDEFLDILRALDEAVKAGKIRYCGISDDTPWGLKEYLHLSDQHDLPRMVSVQNEFNLLHLKDSPYLLESCMLDDVAFLPWSPLGGGVLTGKYRNGEVPENTRWSMSQRNGLFRDTPAVHAAIEAYLTVAEKHGLSLAELSLAWLNHLPGVTSTIIGATTMPQLKENIAAFDIELSDEVLQDVLAVIKAFPSPF